MNQPLTPEGGLFDRLRSVCATEWRTYTGHEFVCQMAAGTLDEAAFRHYLVQDYLFLIQFARAYALAVYKADALEDMRAAAQVLNAILESEMRLHIDFCARWGIGPAEIEAAPEATATIAYTRFVLDCGMAGDALDLAVALAPCIVGYAEIALAVLDDKAARLDGNPYREWIEMYAGDEYVAVAREAVAQLDRLAASRATPARFDSLGRIFRQATRLEAGFWDMGLMLAD